MSGRDLDRPFMTLGELARHWNGDANLVRHALVTGKLVPSVFLDGVEAASTGDAEPAPIHGMYYLHKPRQRQALQCEYWHVAKTPSLSDGFQCLLLSKPVPLSDVEDVGVIDADQVERYELGHPRKVSLRRVRVDLRTLERASLLKMVIGMAIDGYGYDPAERRSARIPEIAQGIRRLGIKIDDDTVRTWVYEAAQSHLPINWRELLRSC